MIITVRLVGLLPFLSLEKLEGLCLSLGNLVVFQPEGICYRFAQPLKSCGKIC